MNKGYFHVIAGSLPLFICVSVQAATSYTYTSIDYPGATETRAFGIDGSNIVGTYYGGFVNHGFKYDGSSYTTLDATSLGASSTYAYGIDGNNIVGHYSNALNNSGFKYDGSSYTALDLGMTALSICLASRDASEEGYAILSIII